MLKEYLKIHWIIITVLLFPLISFAQVSEVACSKSGYTVATINGIFTKEGSPDDSEGAEANRIAVKRLFSTTYKGEPLTFDYLYNPTHGFFGAIDVTDVAIQKTFEGVDMQDPDFLKMLNDASTQIKTQKLLLVAHSQGNFYANNFYNTVTTNGDISPKSIGVYGVGSPAKEVAGSGEYLTSSTDTVINKVRKVLHGTVLKANDWIEYKETDDSGSGHGFREIYLNYRGEEIKKGIEESLAKLSVNQNRSEDVPCVASPQKRTAIGKVSHVIDYGAQFAVASGVTAITASSNSAVDNFIKKAPPVIFATWRAYDNTVTVAIWVRTTTIAVGNTITDTVMAIGSFAKNAFTGLLSGGPILAGSNSAAVILATQGVQSSPLANVNNGKASTIPVPSFVNNQPVVAVPLQTQPLLQSQPQTVFIFEPKAQGDTSAPKLVFVGSFGGGGGATTLQVLGTQSAASVVEEVVVVGGGGAGDVLTAPTLSAPQCAQTLATDGCLLATTTVHFEWAPVSGASYYATIKNGAYSTTTDTTLDVEIKDFSDYTLDVVAVGAGGTASATGTQAVSVATIPLAINEIAWMGTKANTSDEWFEIKNNTTHTIDLSQWELNAKDGTPHVNLAGTIAPRAYLVFERTDDTAVADVSMHQKFTSELENIGDQLTLSRASTTFDQTPDGAWVAGATTTRQTMERYSSRESGTDPANWGTNLGYIKNGIDADSNAINGTPGAQNSVSTLVNKGQDISSDFTLTADEERYVVPRQILINASSTLTIEPGVVIQFYHGGLLVNGVIYARGTQENPIIFNSFSGTQTGGFWVDDATATSTFDHVWFEDMGSIVVSGSDVEIRNSDFAHTDGGVEAYENATIFIENTHFASSTSDTIGVYEGSMVRIASSTIENQLDGDAIGIYDGSFLVMSSTTIDGVHDGNGIGAYDSFVSIASSTIRNTESTAISLSNSTTTIASTLVQGGTLNDWASGISIDGGTATVTDTTVTGFTEGAGIAVSLQREEVPPYRIFPGIVADISSTEITRNATGIEMEVGSASIAPDVSVHDNTKNIVVCQTDGECVEQ